MNVLELDPTEDIRIDQINCDTQLVTVRDGVALPPITAFRLLAARLRRLGRRNPILLKDCLNFEPVPLSPEVALLRAAVNLGALLADGIGDAILVRGESGAGCRCGWRSMFCRRRGAAVSRRITWRVRAAGARCSISRRSQRASRRARCISRA